MHPPVRAYERRGGTGGRGRPFVSDSIHIRIDLRPDVATQSMPLTFSPATPEAVGAWITELIKSEILRPIGGWINLKQV